MSPLPPLVNQDPEPIPVRNAINDLIFSLKEGTRALQCLYDVEGVFSNTEANMQSILSGIVRVLPKGWQHHEVCVARIRLGDQEYTSNGFKESPWQQRAPLNVQDTEIGEVAVFYTSECPPADEGPFLTEERKLLRTVADRLEGRLLREALKALADAANPEAAIRRPHYWVIIDLLRKTDTKVLTHITRKMLNTLSWEGIDEAGRLTERFDPSADVVHAELISETNIPLASRSNDNFNAITDDVFAMAEKYLGERKVIQLIQKWITEDRSNFLVKILENASASQAELTTAIERFHTLVPQGLELSPSREKGFRVSIIRKLLNDDPNFLNIAKNVLELNDFYELLQRIIFPSGSYGKVGGKGAGLFLAEKIIAKAARTAPQLADIKVPKTWYLTSDGILNFIRYNELEDLIEQKYEDLAQVRREYPYIVHVFKNSPLPREIINGLAAALDEFGDSPLIVRSSSLLEDRLGASFAGKYKSLFLANQGPKRQRLVALMDAVTEVYASTFSPDPIEYRIEHGFIDFNEEMGILIQEVVGTKVGHYYLPAFAGVGFANNEYRWSPRIHREDGLLRMVPGLGTRAVDRISDDYPMLVAPGQPNLRVNITQDEKIRYCPKNLDVINLKTNSFETIAVRDLLKEYGDDYPMIHQLISVHKNDRLERSSLISTDFTVDQLVMTFEGLFDSTNFIERMRLMLQALQHEFGTPVDLEFAHDGKTLYLLQCRPQSYSRESLPATIPANTPADQTLFTANKSVTNGTVSNITHVVYVDPEGYAELSSRNDLLAVGRAVGKLNQMLPRRQFILIGPGRWGSRGDIKLGVSVTYSDINNSAMLIELARKLNGYVPDLSFGTHFFQDLVEANIRYLPLYPDDETVIFNTKFLTESTNQLTELLPEYAHISGALHVIDIADATDGQALNVLMNGERDQAIALFAEPTNEPEQDHTAFFEPQIVNDHEDAHWRWRQNAAERIAALMDGGRFGVKGMYLFGSTRAGTAGPKSDIDLLVHFSGNDEQGRDLLNWLDGWSLALSEQNYQRTGVMTDGLLNVRIVTDEDVTNRTRLASKINSASDPARSLQIGKPMKR